MIRASVVSLVALAALASAPIAAKPNAQEEAQPADQQTADPQAANEERMKASAKVLQRSLDALRARNFEGWLATYSPNVIVRSPQMHINNRKELRAIYRVVFDANLPDPEILESGWTGERIFVRQREYLPEGTMAGVTYAEYEIKGGLITSVNAYIE